MSDLLWGRSDNKGRNTYTYVEMSIHGDELSSSGSGIGESSPLLGHGRNLKPVASLLFQRDKARGQAAINSSSSASGSEEGSRQSPAPVSVPGKRHGARGQPTGTPYSVSAPAPSVPLITPLVDENDIATASSYNSESSAFLRRKEAASGGIGQYESLGNGVNDLPHQHQPRKYQEIKDQGPDKHSDIGHGWFHVPESSEHKREEHATTCVFCSRQCCVL